MDGRLTGQFGTDTRGWRRLLEMVASLGSPSRQTTRTSTSPVSTASTSRSRRPRAGSPSIPRRSRHVGTFDSTTTYPSTSRLRISSTTPPGRTGRLHHAVRPDATVSSLSSPTGESDAGGHRLHRRERAGVHPRLQRHRGPRHHRGVATCPLGTPGTESVYRGCDRHARLATGARHARARSRPRYR